MAFLFREGGVVFQHPGRLPDPRTPGGGDLMTIQPYPVQAKGNGLPPRGRVSSNPGGPVPNPPVVLTNSFEGGTNGVTITSGNSGGASGNAFNLVGATGVTNTYSNANAAHGSLSGELSTTTAAVAYWRWNAPSFPSVSQAWFRFYAYFTANPANQHRVWNATGSASVASVFVSISGKLQVTYGGSGTPFVTFTTSIPLNQWFRVEGFVVANASAGQVSASLYSAMDSVIPTETHTSAANLNTASGNPSTYSFGCSSSVASVGPFWMDDLGLSDTGPLGPSNTAIVYPQTGPVQAKGSNGLPLRGRVIQGKILASAITPPSTGPVFRQATQPAQARIPQVFSKGRVSSNPGSNPAILLLNSFEGGTQGTGVTSGNSGGASGNAFDLVNIGALSAITFDNTESDAAGFLAGKFTTGSPSSNDYVGWAKPLGLQNQVWFRAYCYFPAFAGNVRLIRVLTPSGTLCAAIQVNNSGKVQTLNSAGAQQTISTLTLPVNQWFRLEGYFIGSQNRGQIQVKIFVSNPYGTVPDETDTSGSAVATIGTFGDITFGNPSSVANYTFWLDDLGVSNTGYIGPVNPRQYGALTAPVRGRIPQNGPRGRIIPGNPGGPVSNPPPPVITTGPCPILDEAGSVITDESGNWILSEGCHSTGAQPGPVQAKNNGLPPRGRVSSNRGAPVHNPQAGPPFRQATKPASIRFTLPPRGRNWSNPGSPIFNPSGSRAAIWQTGQTYTRWQAGLPYARWQLGQPYTREKTN